MKKRISVWPAALVLLMALMIYAGAAGGSTVSVQAATPTPRPSATPTPTPMPRVEYVTASYTGESVVVGKLIKREDIEVHAIWDNGEIEEVGDYNIADLHVKVDGVNIFIVSYKGKTDTFEVMGKKLTGIQVAPSRTEFHVGNAPDIQDVMLMAEYSDNSSEEIKEGVTFSPGKLYNTGWQEVRVSYGGFSDTFAVYVYPNSKVKTLSAVYHGTLIVGELVDPNKLEVNAVFDDYTTERITTYSLQARAFTTPGNNPLRVVYNGVIAETNVEVTARQAVSLRCVYASVQKGIMVGDEFNEADLYVYVTFNDGKEERVQDYTVSSKVIRYVGDNTVKITYNHLNSEVTVKGIEYSAPDFSYTNSFDVDSPLGSFTVTTALPRKVEENGIVGKVIKQSKLKKIYRKLKSEGAYCGFSYNFANNDDEVNLPVTVRIRVPDGFEPEFLDLYFSPNLKSIMGCMNKTKIDEHTLEITIYKTGSYLVVYDPDMYLQPTAADEDEDED